MNNVVSFPGAQSVESDARTAYAEVHSMRIATVLSVVDDYRKRVAAPPIASEMRYDQGYAHGLLASLYLLNLITDEAWTELRNAIDAEARRHG